MNLDTQWVVGFVDGEGCFFVGIQQNPKTSLGYQVIPEFRVVQHKRDASVLYALKRFFGAGRICQNHGDRWELRIRKLDELNRIVQFFEIHPLKTKKRIDFQKFRKVMRLMEERAHLNEAGLRKIAAIASEMNTQKRVALEPLLDSPGLDEDKVHSALKDAE